MQRIWCFTFLENPPLNKDLRKRKRAEEDEEIQRKIFQPDVDSTEAANNCGRDGGDGDGVEDGDSQKSSTSSKSSKSSDDESPVEKFRRGCDLPSDLDCDGDNSADSSNNDDLEDDGDWNMMGAALEREFLGLDWLNALKCKFTNDDFLHAKHGMAIVI